MMTHYDCGEQVCSSHLKWLEDAVKRSFRPAAKRGVISEVKNLDTLRALAAFRIYNPSIGKFLSVDPLIEDYPAWSPFNYVMGNPIRLIDPSGMNPENGGDPPSNSSDCNPTFKMTNMTPNTKYGTVVVLPLNLDDHNGAIRNV